MRTAHLLWLAFLLLPAACGSPDTPPCDPTQQACVLEHDFGVTALSAGQEINGQCNSWTLHNPTDLWVSAVELSNDGGHHHSNWFYVPDHVYDRPDGKWPCGELHFSELNAALLGGVLFAQSTQARGETQRFQPGAVLRVPAWSRIIGNVHLLNASATPLTTGLRLRVHTVPPAMAQVKLSPLRLSYYDLRLPPRTRSEFGASCNVRRAYEDLRREPMRMKLHYALPHYHELGRRFRLSIAGGPRDGRLLFESSALLGEPGGHTFAVPVDLGDADGLRFSCSYDNPRDTEVRWGIGDQEMCVMLGFAESPIAFDAFVEQGQPGTPVNGVVQHSGPCQVRAFNYFAG
ncbi:MAG: hypothetical protein RMK29_13885 [Myxococcales bacterium]|nr:hypothetical protein [Myxococcota bacterium]MDW8282800.1 hypothetical protein [Myxococcales bacterium]